MLFVEVPEGVIRYCHVTLRNTADDSVEDVAVDVRRSRKHCGKAVAVDGIGIQVKCGEVFGFSGPTGAGKMSTQECLEGWRRLRGGTMQVMASSLSENPVR